MSDTPDHPVSPPDATPPGPPVALPIEAIAIATDAHDEHPAPSIHVPTYPLLVRLTHWASAIALVLLIGSGFQIFNAHPVLYASDASDTRHVAFSLTEPAGDGPDGLPIYRMTVMGHQIGVGHIAMETIPPTMTFGGWLAGGRRVHFTMAWLLVGTGTIYMIYMLASRRKRAVWLQRDEWRELGPALRDHLKIPPVLEGHGGSLNPLQKLAYAVVPIVLVPFVIATGLALSPQWDAIVPFWSDLFGGRQFARTWHFVGMALLLGFIASHVFLVALSGWGTLMHMISGRVAPGPQGDAE